MTGITVLNNDGVTVLCDVWDLRKYKGFFNKVAYAKSRIKELKLTHEIERIYVEESLQSFRSGFSSAQTLSTLAKFNGTLSWLCWEVFNIEPEYINASTARKLYGVKVPRGQKAKEVVLKKVLDTEPNFSITYTKHGNPKPGTYDKADSLVIAKAGYEICIKKKAES